MWRKHPPHWVRSHWLQPPPSPNCSFNSDMVKASDVILIVVSPLNGYLLIHVLPVYITFIAQQVAILFPPAAAAMVTGCSCDLIINILLTMYANPDLFFTFFFEKTNGCRLFCKTYRLGYLPGEIHAFWLIYRKMQAEERYGHTGFVCEFFFSPFLNKQVFFSQALTFSLFFLFLRHRKWSISAPIFRVKCSGLWSYQ